jgi:hypothetical protein
MFPDFPYRPTSIPDTICATTQKPTCKPRPDPPNTPFVIPSRSLQASATRRNAHLRSLRPSYVPKTRPFPAFSLKKPDRLEAIYYIDLALRLHPFLLILILFFSTTIPTNDIHGWSLCSLCLPLLLFKDRFTHVSWHSLAPARRAWLPFVFPSASHWISESFMPGLGLSCLVSELVRSIYALLHPASCPIDLYHIRLLCIRQCK